MKMYNEKMFSSKLGNDSTGSDNASPGVFQGKLLHSTASCRFVSWSIFRIFAARLSLPGGKLCKQTSAYII